MAPPILPTETSINVRARTCYSDRLHDFTLNIPKYYKDVYVNSLFPHTVRFRNSWPI